MADKRICVYLSQRDQGDSPPGTAAEVVYETLILPRNNVILVSH